MEILTDSPDFAGKIIRQMTAVPPSGADGGNISDDVYALADRLLRRRNAYRCGADFHPLWKCLLITERASRSQFDDLIAVIRERPDLPGGILCLAGNGTGFHGTDGRPWLCGGGNLHLCAFLAPGPDAPRRTAAYMVLSVVSVLQALDWLELASKAAVKWVNDIIIGDAKVGGALVHTQNLGVDVTGVVLGIGLNVETAPAVQRDRFVPRAGSLAEFAKEKAACGPGPVFRRLSGVLADNYGKLLNGGYRELHEIYAARSAVLGRRVAVYDGGRELRRGRAVSIGDSLELFLEGETRPVTGGRLALLPG